MKWLVSAIAFLAIQVVSASPLEKRASVNDVANVGYATLNGGTSGGSGGPTTVVTTLAALTSAVAGDAKKVVIISGTITGDTVVKVGSNTSVLGRNAVLNGVGLRVINVSNVIIRNIKITKVLASAGDAIGVQAASQVWLDHLDLSRTCSYDGLLDITHGAKGVTVSNSKLSNHWKASLVGHSDSNGSEDVAITVTYASNLWSNKYLHNRTPSFRFGRGHIFNNVFDNNNDGINTRDGAQLLVENNIHLGTNKPLYATDQGFAVARGNDFGGASNTAPVGTFTTAPYSYSLVSTSSLRSQVVANAGATISF